MPDRRTEFRSPIPLFPAPWLVAIALAACGGSPEDSPASSPPEAKGIDPARVAAIQALPYLGGTTKSAGGDHDTPILLHDRSRCAGDPRLYTTQDLSRADLIDPSGALLHTWSHSPSFRWEHVELLPQGDLIVVGVDPHQWPDEREFVRIADESRHLLRIDRRSEVLWKRQITAHHDAEIGPKGSLTTLTFERRDIRRIHPILPVRDDQIAFLDPRDGTLREQRGVLATVLAHPARFRLIPVHPSELGGPPWIDLFHANSVEWMRHDHLFGTDPLYASNYLLLCFRHQSRVAIFDWEKNEVLWSWGAGTISGPHDAQLLDTGNILLFDNGLGRDYSRAIELDPRTDEIVWQYLSDPPTDFYTESKGSVQRLPNGNTLLAESDAGRAIEVTPTGEIVWEFFCPHESAPGERAAIVRMRRIDPSRLDWLFPHLD